MLREVFVEHMNKCLSETKPFHNATTTLSCLILGELGLLGVGIKSVREVKEYLGWTQYPSALSRVGGAAVVSRHSMSDYVSSLCFCMSFCLEIGSQIVVDRLGGMVQLLPGEEFDYSESCKLSSPTHSGWRSGMASRPSIGDVDCKPESLWSGRDC